MQQRDKCLFLTLGNINSLLVSSNGHHVMIPPVRMPGGCQVEVSTHDVHDVVLESYIDICTYK